MAYSPVLGKVFLALDSVPGEIRTFAFDPPSWTLIGSDYLSMPSTYGDQYLGTLGLVFDENIKNPLIFGLVLKTYIDPGQLLLIPYRGNSSGDWYWACDGCLKGAVINESRSAAVAYDTRRLRSVLFGLLLGMDSESWVHEFDGSRFFRTSPPEGWAFRSGVAGFDPGTGQTVFFGTVRDGHGPETVEYDGTNWALVETSQAPSKETGMTPLAYVPALGGLVGADRSGGGMITWLYRAGDWSILEVQVSPPPRPGAKIVYDETGARVLFFAGMDGNDESSDEVWELVRMQGHRRPVERP